MPLWPVWLVGHLIVSPERSGIPMVAARRTWPGGDTDDSEDPAPACPRLVRADVGRRGKCRPATSPAIPRGTRS